MIKLIILFLLGSVSVYATTYNIVVTNDDHVDILYHIIKGIDYFFGIDNTIHEGADRYLSIINFVLVVGTVWALVQLSMAAMSGNGAMGFKHYFMYLFLIFTVGVIIYGPKSAVLVQTRAGTNYQAAHNVPMIFAFTLSMFTELRLELSDLTEEAFNVPDPTDNFLSGGSGGLGYFGGQINLSSSVTSATFASDTNRTLKAKYTAYTRDCVILPSLSGIGGQTKMNSTMNSTDVKGNIAPNSTTYGSELVSFDGQTGTCDDFWLGTGTSFGTGFTGLLANINSFENDVNQSRKLSAVGSSLAYFGAIMDNDNAIAGASEVKAAVTQAVLSNEFRSTFAKMGVAGEVAADGAEQTMANMQLNGMSTGMFVASQLPRAAFLLFALMVASTPFVLAFALFPGSFSILLNFLKTLLWISLWEPMANILGIFQDYYFSELLLDNGYTTVNAVLAMNANNVINLSSEAAGLAGLAGTMFIAIQGLSWMLITGSGQMIGNMMSSVGSSFQNNASADAQLQNRGDMQEAALMSKELGRSVSMREKYAYSASMNAATNAGELSGNFKTHGANAVGAGHSKTHATTATTVDKQTNARATANSLDEVYSGPNGTDTESLVTAKTGNTTLKMMSENVSGTAVNKMDKPVKTAVATVIGNTPQVTRESLEKTQKHMGQDNIQDAAEVHNENQSTNTADSNSKTSANVAAHEGVQNKLQATSVNSEFAGYTESETAQVHSDEGSGNMKQQAAFQVKSTVQAGYVKEDTFESQHDDFVAQKSSQVQEQTKMESDLSSVRSELSNILDSDSKENAKKLAEAAQKYSNSPKTKDDLAEFNKVRNKTQRSNIGQQEARRFNESNAKHEKTKERWSKAQDDYSKIPSSATDAEKDTAKETLDREAALFTASSMGHQRETESFMQTEVGNLLVKEEQLMSSIAGKKEEINQTNKNIDATDISKTGSLQGKKSLQDVAIDENTNPNTFFEQGERDAGQLEAMQRVAEESNLSNEELGGAIGLVKGMDIAGNALSLSQSGETILKTFDNAGPEAIQQLRNMGISDETMSHVRGGFGTNQEKSDITAAAQGLSHLKKNFTMNGKNMSATMDSNGKIGAMTQDGTKTYSDGTKIQYDFTNSLVGTQLDAGDSEAKVATLKAMANVVDIGVGFVAGKTSRMNTGLNQPTYAQPASNTGGLGKYNRNSSTAPTTPKNSSVSPVEKSNTGGLGISRKTPGSGNTSGSGGSSKAPR